MIYECTAACRLRAGHLGLRSEKLRLKTALQCIIAAIALSTVYAKLYNVFVSLEWVTRREQVQQ